MTDHSKATPRPWKRLNHSFTGDGNTLLVGACFSGIGTLPAASNAALIVEAVNSHDRLVEENKRLRTMLDEIGSLLCDKTVGEMMTKNVITQGATGETEDFIALTVMSYLQKRGFAILDRARAALDRVKES